MRTSLFMFFGVALFIAVWYLGGMESFASGGKRAYERGVPKEFVRAEELFVDMREKAEKRSQSRIPAMNANEAQIDIIKAKMLQNLIAAKNLVAETGKSKIIFEYNQFVYQLWYWQNSYPQYRIFHSKSQVNELLLPDPK